MKKPHWTVLYNIVSPESDKWVGTGWEFFDSERDAEICYFRQKTLGNCPTKRPYFDSVDFCHLGAAHQYWMKKDNAEKELE